MFSPGLLSAQSTRGLVFAGASSHAEIESQCKLCHQPLTLSQGESCLKCHEDIANQVDQQIGTTWLSGKCYNLQKLSLRSPGARF